MEHKRKVGTRVFVIGAVLLILITLLTISGATSGMTGSSNSSYDGIKEYRSIKELVENTPFSVNMPNFVYEYDGKIINATSTMGQVIEVDTGNFVFKASQLISYNADILGMYEDTEKDYMYTVDNNDSGIKFIRYRLEYPDYEHCTIINWCTDTSTQGLIFGNILTEDEILDIFGIDKEQLHETSREEIAATEGNEIDTVEETAETDIEYDKYTLGNKVTVEIPKFASSINVIDENGIAMFYVDKVLTFVIIYNDYDIQTDAFSGQEEVELTNGVVLKYRAENPFDHNHIDYDNYENFLGNIEHIKQTIILE